MRKDICDFCDSPYVVRRYQCMDFDAESKAVGVLYPGEPADPRPTNLVFQSKNYWAACSACAAFVDAEDIDGLVRYVKKTSVDPSVRLSPERKQQLLRHMRHMYELFFKTRIRVKA